MTFITIFLLLLFIGYGLASIVVKKTVLDDTLVRITLAPLIAVALFSLFAIYELGLNINLHASYSVAFIAVVMVAFKSVSIVKDILEVKNYLKDTKNFVILFLFFSTIVFLILFFGTETGRIRHGLSPDIAAYLSAMNHLSSFGTLSNVNNAFSDEILNKAFRWAVPYCASQLQMMTGFSSYKVLLGFILVVFVVGSLLIARIHVLVNNLQKNHFATLLIFISLVGNAALLDFLYEGFYPQIISIVCFGLILSLFHVIRSTKEQNPSLLFGILLLFIVILSAYSELFILAIAFVLGMVLFDFIQKNNNQLATSLLLGMTIIGAVIVSLPLSSHIYDFTIANSGNFRNIGYPLPSYMFPSDFVGLTNIFSESALYLDDSIATHIVKITKTALLLKIILSITVLYIFVKYINKNYNNKNIFLVIAFGIVSIFIVNSYLSHYRGGVENYLYNKLSSTFILYLTAVFFAYLLQRRDIFVASILYLTLFYSSYSYVKDSYRYDATIEPDLIEKFQQNPELKQYIYLPNERGYRNGSVEGKLRYIDRTDEYMLRGLLGIFTLDQWNLADRANMPNNEVILLARKDYLNDIAQSKDNLKILFETKNYIAFHTGVLVYDIPKVNEAYSALAKLFIR